MGDFIHHPIVISRPELVGLKILVQSQVQKVDIIEEFQSNLQRKGHKIIAAKSEDWTAKNVPLRNIDARN